MSQLIIRDFDMNDYQDVVNLWRIANLPYKPEGRDSPKRIAQQVESKNTIFLIAGLDRKVVGCVIGTHDGRKGWINRLAVDKQFRRQNIAKRLVGELERRFEILGLEVVACLIEEHNNISIEVFKKLGYEEANIKYLSKRKNSGS